jgi:hypothetical protein
MTVARFLNRLAGAGLLLLTLVVPQTVAGQSLFDDRDATFSFGGVHFPAVVDTFAVLHTTRFTRLDLGVMLRYGSPIHPVVRFDLYVYPAPDTVDVDDGARAEFDGALESIRRYAERRAGGFELITSPAVDSITVTDVSGRSHTGWRAMFEAREQGVPQHSSLWVFRKGRSYLKYRLAYPTEVETDMEGRVRVFVERTLDRVATVEP